MKAELQKLQLLLMSIKDPNIESFCITEYELKHIHGIDIFKDLLIQNVTRTISNKDVSFICIKNIVVKEEYRGMNILTSVVEAIEMSNVHVFIDDIINHRLFSFFHKRGYTNFKYNSPYGWKKCMYKLNNSKF